MSTEHGGLLRQSPEILEAQDISVFYGRIQAVWGVSFKVEKSRITGLLGSNGAGKTAIMKAVSGLLSVSGGALRFGNTFINDLSSHERVELGISLVPEGRKLFPRLSVKENLEIGAFNKGARKELRKTAEWFFQIFPVLSPRKKQMAGSLSGGEQQMLAIGRGLMARPRLLMLDEPSLGLAPLMVKTVFEIVSLIKEQGLSVFLVEQNVKHTLRLADQAYVLENGRVTLEGRGIELMENPHIREAYLGL